VLLSGEDITREAIDQEARELGDRARDALGEPGAELEATFELRYRGQSFELAVSAGPEASPDELREAFEAQHEERYGYRASDQTLELVTIRVTATTPGAEVELGSGAEGEPEHSRRPARLDAEEVELDVLGGELPPGTETSGPAVIELPESSVLVPSGWSASVDDTGSVHLKRDA
jgi:N-methylhydantoinase A